MPSLPAPRQWTEPPLDLDPQVLDIRSVRGDQVALTRAVVLSLIPPEALAQRAGEIPGALRFLLERAPAPDTWVPIEDYRALVNLVGASSQEGLLGHLARLTAERDAGKVDWLTAPEIDRKLPEGGPEDLVRGIPFIFRSYFQGGTANVEFLEGQEAGISLWMWDLFPGWARKECPEWIRRALEQGYGVRAQVTYLEPAEAWPWWHRYHLQWS